MDKLKKELLESRREAQIDTLTGLANRKTFDELLYKLTTQIDKNNDEQLSVIFADIDSFKSINDKEGHLVGDQVIKIVSNTLNSSLKGRDLVARYGGEEFAILLLKTSFSDAKKIAEDIRQSIENKIIKRKDTNEYIGKITISSGVALYVLGEGVESFMRRADEALYAAKRGGCNRVISF